MDGSINLLKQALSTLKPSEQKAASFIIADPSQVINLTITQLAQKANTSTSAITRLCQKIGVESFSKFKLDLTKDLYSNSGEDTSLDLFDEKALESAKTITDAMVDMVRQNVSLIGAVLDPDAIEKSCKAIESARKILLVGVGASGLVAMDLQQKLIRLGIFPSFSTDTDVSLVQAETLGPKDLCMVFSYSGATPSILRIAQVASKQKCTIIAVTKIGDNRLAKLSDLILAVPESESLFRQGATFSRISQLVIVDILYTNLIVQIPQGKELLRSTWEIVHHDA
ncbi:MAG: MurR/RpiR family transcriptional regulator [Spirochaetia bacterium]|jgi:DNA-binding MurR/RpiR family transcriptional regulator|nr:MurR/RpiR family transcriptional regulator [Spirochaetia bacterium]